ncbi:MAG: hypothetical protein OCD02_09685 [Spirochaetaceae bacterium]
MIRKLFIQLFFVTLIICFFGLNFETKIDIRFWFNDLLTLKDISLFVALAFAYLIGVVTTIPFIIIKSIKKKKNDKVTTIEE